MAGTVFKMLAEVLDESKQKLAADREAAKTKTASVAAVPQVVPEPNNPAEDLDPEKIASACDAFADRLHEVVDDRTPQEKIAEYYAIQEAIQKAAAGMTDEPKGKHQTTKAEPASIPPMTPSLAGKQMGAGKNQFESDENRATGTGIEASGGGKANPDSTPDKAIKPNEKANPQDAANALETNRSNPPGAGSEAPMKIAQQRARQLTKLAGEGKIRPEVAASMIRQDQQKIAAGMPLPPALAKNVEQVTEAQDPGQPGAEKETGEALKKAARDAGVPEKYANAIIAKFAEDALNPAQVSAGTVPILQSTPGTPPAQSQGSESGQLTPSTRGKDPGRELVSSVVSAINATKGQAKNVKSEMAGYLDEPAQASSHDSVLQQSLDNTSNAGVKIASARALLQTWAAQSQGNRVALDEAVSQVKVAQGGDAGLGAAVTPAPTGAVAGGMQGLASAGTAAQAPPIPGSGVPGAKTAMPMPPVSDEAMAAAAEGVTPEELAQAEALLEASGSEGAEPPPEGMGPPPAEGAPIPQGQA